MNKKLLYSQIHTQHNKPHNPISQVQPGNQNIEQEALIEIRTIMIKKLQHICIIPLVLVSLITNSQLVQAQLSFNENTSFKQPKLPPNGAPTGRRRAGAGRNPECPSSLTRLTALVPGNGNKSFYASTVAAYPTFWFYIPELPKTARSAEFVLHMQSGKDVKNVYRTSFSLSGKPGIVSINPPQKPQYALDDKKTYHWYFHIYCGDPNETSDNFYVDGFIQRIILTYTLKRQLETAHPKEYIAYSANNIWYDVLTNLGQLRRANPQNASINRDWIKLLNAIGLSKFSAEPIVEHYNLEK